MEIHSIYRFKLTDSANKIFRYFKKYKSHEVFNNVQEIKLVPIKGDSSIREYRLLADNKAVGVLRFTKPSWGIGIFPNSDDLLIVKNTFSKRGFFQIIVLKGMRPYSGLACQHYRNGNFTTQIRALRKSFVQ